jgi:hypothetical protein
MTRIEAASVMKIFQKTLAMEPMKVLTRTRRWMTGSSQAAGQHQLLGGATH